MWFTVETSVYVQWFMHWYIIAEKSCPIRKLIFSHFIEILVIMKVAVTIWWNRQLYWTTGLMEIELRNLQKALQQGDM